MSTENNEKRKKKLSPKAKQIIDITVTAVQVVIVIFCIVLSIIVWTGAEGDPINRSVNWFAIRTDSMTENPELDYEALNFDKKLCFNPGDLVIVKKAKFEDIKVGDVIAFKDTLTDALDKSYEQVVTHRVIAIDVENKEFTCAGDLDTGRTQNNVGISIDEVYGKMTGELKGVGSIILWLQGYRKITTEENRVAYDRAESSTSFLVIVIPLALLFLYNGFYVVKWAMDEKVKKAKELAKREAAAAAAAEAVDSAAIQREAIRTFMTSQGMTEEQITAYFAEQDAKAAANKAEEADKHNLEQGTSEEKDTPCDNAQETKEDSTEVSQEITENTDKPSEE